MENRNKKKISLIFLILTLAAGYPTAVFSQDATQDAATDNNSNDQVQQEDQTQQDLENIPDIQSELKKQRESIDQLKKQAEIYEKKIQSKRNEAFTIKNQLSSIEDEIDKNKIDLDITRREITKTNLLMIETQRRIDEKDKEIANQKERISEFIRLLYQNQDKSYVEILLANDAFSEFFDQMHYMKTVEEDLSVILKKIKAIKEKLEIEKKQLQEEKKDLESLTGELTRSQMILEDKITAKNVLLEATQSDEEKFQTLLKQVRAEQAQINSDIVRLEIEIRKKLEAKGDKTLSELSGQGFIWPTEGRIITAKFHDPSYPFRRYFEHPAIDIRAKQGTPIRAAASGYVSRAQDSGMGYSYISIIHADGFSTVYGHVSCINVTEDDFVVQGQTVGCTGGTPGTPGAGRLTTGPHLHLEIRLNGIPVNPEEYLP